VCVFLFLVFIFPLISISFSTPVWHTHNYLIPKAQVDYHLFKDGSVSVTEKITYNLSGSFHELYRQLPSDLVVSNENGYCVGKNNCEFSTQMNNEYHKLVLKSDYHDESVTVVFSYTIEGQIVKQKNSAQFFYKLWGAQWKKKVGNLKAIIYLPENDENGNNDDGIFYFIYPVGDEITSIKKNGKIIINSDSYPPNTYLEINLLMPTKWFVNLPKAKEYMSNEDTKKTENGDFLTTILLITIFILLPVIYTLFYFKYGKEKPLRKLEFFGPYEREASDNLSPAESQYLIDRTVKPEAVAGELLWLVQKEYLIMKKSKTKVNTLFFSHKTKDGLIFIVNNKKDYNGLKPHQKVLIQFIIDNFNGKLVIENLREKQMEYEIFYKKFVVLIKKSFDEKKYLDTRGNKYMGISLVIIFLIVMGFVVLSSVFNMIVIPSIIIKALFLEISFFIYLFNAKPEILGRWNDNGRIVEHKTKNFKKYLDNMTFMREKPVESIVLWEMCLAYATAFGVAKKVLDVVNTTVPKIERNNSMFIHSLYITPLSSSLVTVTRRATGVGGGGAGGGGGGAR